MINGKKKWIRETWEQYSHRLVTKLASVTGDSEEILHLISDKLLECTLGVLTVMIYLKHFKIVHRMSCLK